MAKRKKSVTLQVGSNFFDNLFEPSRRKMEQQVGAKVSQTAFSDMIVNSGIKFDIKLNKKPLINGKKKIRKKKV